MNDRGRERREFQRLVLSDERPARFGDRDVRLVDLGMFGARIDHDFALDKGQEADLSFEWVDEDLVFESAIVHAATDPEAGYYSGLRFFKPVDGSDRVIRRMLAELVTVEIDRICSEAAIAEFSLDADEDRPFVRHQFDEGQWHVDVTSDGSQPRNGITLPMGTHLEEVGRLRISWALSDEEGQSLVKLFAELAVVEVLGRVDSR